MMSDSSPTYSRSEQLFILWLCLGAGGFASIVIICWCRFVRQRPNGVCFFPPPLPPATPSRHIQHHHDVESHRKASQATPAVQAAFLFESAAEPRTPFVSSDVAGQMMNPDVSQTADSHQYTRHDHYLQEVPETEGTEPFSDPLVQEMMMFSRNALLRAGVDPSSMSFSDGGSNFSTNISIQPPLDGAAAIQEMLQYTSGVLQFMSLERSQPPTSAV